MTRCATTPTTSKGTRRKAPPPALEAPRLGPVHPGEVLASEFLTPLALSPSELAEHLRLPTERLEQLLNRQRSVSAEDALRLALLRHHPRVLAPPAGAARPRDRARTPAPRA